MTQQPLTQDPLAPDAVTAARVAAQLATQPASPVRAVFFDDAAARIFDAVPGVEATAWGPLLARQVTEAFPPRPLAAVAPPPIVVGDAPLARMVAEAWARGWAEPGQPLTVHCVGLDPAWSQEAREETVGQGVITWSQCVLRPGPIVRRVLQLVAQWPAPNAKKTTPAGPAVVVATAEDVTTLAIAVAVAREVPGARVAAVVSGDTAWPELDGVAVFTGQQAVAAVDDTRESRLARLLLRELGWLGSPEAEVTAPEAPIFAPFVFDDDGLPSAWEGQSAEVRAELDLVAGNCRGILAAGNVDLVDFRPPGADVVIPTPGELRAMADALLALLGVAPDSGSLLTALEVAHRLPTLAARVGLTPVRPEGYRQVLPFSVVEALGAQVHRRYLLIAAETNNATGSETAFETWAELSEEKRASSRAVVLSFAIACAATGLDWRATDASIAPLEFDAALRDRLGQLEHRRWAHNERRNGNPGHTWLLPWDAPEMTDGAKLYDVEIMRAMPGILATAQVEVFRPAP